MKKKLINIILFVLFTLFAVFQLNDPDPFHWFLIYGFVALISLIAIFKALPKPLIWIMVLGLLIYSGFYIQYFFEWLQIENKSEVFGEMVYQKPYLEGTREFLGLVLAAIALMFQLKKTS
ncbi:MAG: transmembrane 220 family protein [Flaviramulus sp.]|nr:transmembrane 220 family protein [Flaviramulus sp.]